MADVPRIMIVTSWETLMRFAKAEADARQTGDPVALARAEKRHAEYQALCLESDWMMLPPGIRL